MDSVDEVLVLLGKSGRYQNNILAASVISDSLEVALCSQSSSSDGQLVKNLVNAFLLFFV
jgi:hypothetical protein